MWQSLKTFFGASLSKAGALTAIKVWQVALAITVVTASVGTYTYIRLHAPNDTPQHVIVFIGGLNTSMTNCHEDTFDDDTHSEILAFLLSQAAGIANPYVKGCNGLDPNQSYLASPSSMIHFSYNGGAMDPHGFWKPNDYEPCNSVNKDTLAKDIQTFDEMLDKYRQIFPNARFTIVGHSLGGLVGLQGAYDYVVNKGNSDIDKVVTIDSPLKGVQANGSTGSILANLEAKTCSLGGHSGSVITSDLMTLSMASINASHEDLKCDNPNDPRQAKLSWCKGQQLAQRGVGVITLGNDKDSLFCGGLTQTSSGLDYKCYTQTLGTAYLLLSKLYDLTPLPTEGFAIAGLIDTAFGSGHFTLISTPEREQEIIRYILAPVVTINQPMLQTPNLVSPTGTAIPFSASVRCLWGTANQATAKIKLVDGSTSFAGTSTSTSTDLSDTLAIKGVVNLPSTRKNVTGIFYVEAGGNTCQYPTGSDPQIHGKILPTNTDYFGGESTGIPFALTSGAQSTQISGTSSQPSPSNPNNDSNLLAQTPILTVQAGQPFIVYFDYVNTGNTTWTDTNGYQLICDTISVPGTTCMGGKPLGFNGLAVPPGYQSTFYLSLTAPMKAGVYETSWSMAQKGATFGQGQVVVKIKVTPIPPGTITEFPILTAISSPDGITLGPDGNLWFTEDYGNQIGRITLGGSITEFPIPTANGSPLGITTGPDGNLWFTEEGPGATLIGRITPSGSITEFPLPAVNSFPSGITLGSDGNLWFTEEIGNKIGRITPSGSITEFPLPAAKSAPWGIASGPDGNLWFTEAGRNQIGRITPGGSITEFPLPTAKSDPDGIIYGPDGNLWFTENNVNKIGRIVP